MYCMTMQRIQGILTDVDDGPEESDLTRNWGVRNLIAVLILSSTQRTGIRDNVLNLILGIFTTIDEFEETSPRDNVYSMNY